MTEAIVFGTALPNDSKGRALGIFIRRELVCEVIEPGLRVLPGLVPTLADTALGLLNDLAARENSSVISGYVAIRIDRIIDEELLLHGELRVLDCDKRKIFALIATLVFHGSLEARKLIGLIVETLSRGAIPLRLSKDLVQKGSVHIHLLGESLELRPALCA